MFIEAGILICIYKNNILLYSGESYETINETMKWLEKNKSLIKGISTNSQIVYGYDNTFMDVLKYNGSSYTEHFSLEKDGYTYINLSKEIEAKWVIIAYVTLHVGLGTFRPVEVENVLEHHMHSEYYVMSKETADILNKAKEEGRRIIAVGTTSTRTLETIASNNDGRFVATSGNTEIFIYPGYEFKGINCLITNFHLPKSTLVMLVSALSSKENIMRAYREAINNKYRFFSFGDAMFITDDINDTL